MVELHLRQRLFRDNISTVCTHIFTTAVAQVICRPHMYCVKTAASSRYPHITLILDVKNRALPVKFRLRVESLRVLTDLVR